jgi:transcription elongation GreA/GreB family factor
MEDKSSKFQRLRDQRLPKSLKAIELLENLISHNYESSEAERLEIVTRLDNQIQKLREVYEIPEPDPPPESLPTVVPVPPEITLTKEEDLELIQGLGFWIDLAINHLADNQPQEAKTVLLNIMRS